MSAVLSQASSRNPGADLWILPDIANSRHVLPLDWNLNFQITKSSRHKSQKLPLVLTDIIGEAELQLTDLDLNNEDPLLIPTHENLPNRWTMVLPYSDLSSWVAKVHAAWAGLGQPSFRVFIPTGQSAGSFQKVWQTYSSSEDYTLVLE